MKPLQRRFAVSIILWASLLGATALDARARAAYAQVPSTSKRYQDAQRKLSRR